MKFSELNLIEPVLRALSQEGYQQPTPIQEKAIPAVLQRRDLLGCAQTGTGKTAAFTVPLLQLMQEEQKPQAAGRPIKTLILTPTRELAIQIGESIQAYGRFLQLRSLVIFGGVSQVPQVDGLRRGVDILVATPGRLLDLMNQGFIRLDQIKYFVLDEADRMLDMGFIHDVRRIIAKLPGERQTLFFSATMPPEIQTLSSALLNNPVKVEVTPVSSTAETITQALYHVDKKDKLKLLLHLLNDASMQTLLVFSRTKHGANRIARDLSKAGIHAEAIHGNKSQNARQQALQNFKNRRTRVLVATDIAARGIDIDELSHVANFDLPNIPETYVHRIGRTGRAGASGKAFSFCDAEEKEFLRDIQKLIGFPIPVVEDHPFHTVHSNMAAASPKTIEKKHTASVSHQGQHSRGQQGISGNRHTRQSASAPGSRVTGKPHSSNVSRDQSAQRHVPASNNRSGNQMSDQRQQGQGRFTVQKPNDRPAAPKPASQTKRIDTHKPSVQASHNAHKNNHGNQPPPPVSDIQYKPVFDDLDRW